MVCDQAGFDVRCEWGERGVAELAPTSDVIVLVDVMSFSTAVTIAVMRGARVYPARTRDETAAALAASLRAELAGPRGRARYSLSPASLLSIPSGTRLVLPSPNGATLSLATGSTATLAGCLRNARAVADAATRHGKRVAVIPCGERWRNDGSLRPALEDLVGAGAIIRHLPGTRSPEARIAVAAFEGIAEDLQHELAQCTSGRELEELGFADDIPLIAALDADNCAPILRDGAWHDASAP